MQPVDFALKVLRWELSLFHRMVSVMWWDLLITTIVIFSVALALWFKLARDNQVQRRGMSAEGALVLLEARPLNAFLRAGFRQVESQDPSRFKIGIDALEAYLVTIQFRTAAGQEIDVISKALLPKDFANRNLPLPVSLNYDPMNPKHIFLKDVDGFGV